VLKYNRGFVDLYSRTSTEEEVMHISR